MSWRQISCDVKRKFRWVYEQEAILLIRRFTYVGLQGGNVYQRFHLRVSTGNRNDCASIAMADEYHRAILPVDDAFCRGDIIGEAG